MCLLALLCAVAAVCMATDVDLDPVDLQPVVLEGLAESLVEDIQGGSSFHHVVVTDTRGGRTVVLGAGGAFTGPEAPIRWLVQPEGPRERQQRGGSALHAHLPHARLVHSFLVEAVTPAADRRGHLRGLQSGSAPALNSHGPNRVLVRGLHGWVWWAKPAGGTAGVAHSHPQRAGFCFPCSWVFW